jgi:hypothetical protein
MSLHIKSNGDQHSNPVRACRRYPRRTGIGGRHLQRLGAWRAQAGTPQQRYAQRERCSAAGQPVKFRYLGAGGVWFDDEDADAITLRAPDQRLDSGTPQQDIQLGKASSGRPA